MTMMRVRVPAARDTIETSRAAQVKAVAKYLDESGKLPPKPTGFEDILDHCQVAIDPHQSIHAMPALIEGFGNVVDHLGFVLVHNDTGSPFITSDNPVVYFDPDVPEPSMLPYTVRPPRGRIDCSSPYTRKRCCTAVRI
jgi:hypothetical protein